jgi:very-short-patch-repair endonuclease
VYGRWMAAVLACGPDAALSHRSAAALWGLAQASGARVDVTTPRRSGSLRPGIRLHRVRKMHPQDLAVRDGIPVTSVARTLLDLAEIVDPGGLGRMLEEAERRRLLDLRAVEQACARGHGRRGLKPLLAHLRTLRPAPEKRSDLERRFLALCRELALPPPDVNARVQGFEVDAVWSHRRVVVELDGYAFHHTRGAFERDRARDATLQLAGYRVLRLTARRLAEEPETVAETVRGLLAQPPTGDAAGQSAR